MKNPTQSSYLVTASSMLGLVNQTKKVILARDEYRKRILILKNEHSSKHNIISDEDKDDWITIDEVKQNFNRLKLMVNKFKNNDFLTKNQYNTLLEYIVLSLYSLTPPRRERDYTETVFDIKNDGLLNIVNLNDNTFVFRKYKTSKSHGEQIIDIPKKLMNVINCYLKLYCKQHFRSLSNLPIPFLVKYNGAKFKRLDIYNILSSIFNKKVGSTQMRRLYLTNTYSDNENNMKNDAIAMGTSTDVIRKHYIKINAPISD
jgi:hypothetical protein